MSPTVPGIVVTPLLADPKNGGRHDVANAVEQGMRTGLHAPRHPALVHSAAPVRFPYQRTRQHPRTQSRAELLGTSTLSNALRPAFHVKRGAKKKRGFVSGGVSLPGR